MAAFAKRVNPPKVQEEWERVAKQGKPTSSHVPLVTNPYVDPALITPVRHPYVDVDGDMTPEKPVAPYRKGQVLAQKRLEQQLKQSRKNQKKSDNQEGLDKVNAKVTKKENAAKTPAEKGCKAVKPKSNGKKKAATSKKANGKKTGKPTVRTRKAPDGPMQVAMGCFLEKYKKDNGPNHRNALAAWKVSAERGSIIASLDPSERKRRRFE